MNRAGRAMMIDFTVGVFYENNDGDDEWTALVPAQVPRATSRASRPRACPSA